jgi:hypothetical protein
LGFGFVLFGRPFNNDINLNYYGRDYKNPKLILNEIHLIIPNLICQRIYQIFNPDFFPRVYFFIPILTFDWNPANEPFDIEALL